MYEDVCMCDCSVIARANGRQAEAFKLAPGSLPRGFDNLHNIARE